MAQETLLMAVGTLVRGRYLIKSVLGSGSTGAVYLVKDQKDQEVQYNLQVLKEIRGLKQQERYHFTIGGTSLRLLQHPALPRIHTLFNDDKRECVYVLMDYVEGESLADLPWGKVAWSELRTWCEPLVAALTYLHRQEQPVFHGDIKPANLLRNLAGKVMLVDLGYVLQPDGGGQPNRYRAPEQFTGTLDERADVYGCGALLYTLLSGEEPVDALTRYERVSKKKADPLVPVHKVSALVPRALSEVLQRAMELDAAGRFATVREFWDTLKPLGAELEASQASSGEQKGSQPVSPVTPLPAGIGRLAGVSRPRESGQRATRRGFLPVVALAAALLLILFGGGAWFWGISHGHAGQSGNVAGVAATTGASGTFLNGGSTTVPNTGTYPLLVGRYKGTLTTASVPDPLAFTLVITQQQQKQFSGNFISNQQSGTISGVIDTAGDLHWTVINASGNATLYFYGGLNGIPDQTDSMGGTFYPCASAQTGTHCSVDTTSSAGGSWALNNIGSV